MEHMKKGSLYKLKDSLREEYGDRLFFDLIHDTETNIIVNEIDFDQDTIFLCLDDKLVSSYRKKRNGEKGKKAHSGLRFMANNSIIHIWMNELDMLEEVI